MMFWKRRSQKKEKPAQEKKASRKTKKKKAEKPVIQKPEKMDLGFAVTGRQQTIEKPAPESKEKEEVRIAVAAAAEAELRESKREQEAGAGPSPRELPEGYGDNQIYLMVRDPQWIHAYWEIQPAHEKAALDRLGGNRSEVKSILRVYDLPAFQDQSAFFDLVIQGLARTWNIEVTPNCSYVVEIGLLHRDGRFVALARSNEVTTPRNGMSEVIDEHWMGLDFERMYALSGGLDVGKSSAELQQFMEERLRGALFSGSGMSLVSSPRQVRKEREFWFKVDCEVIIYGATEPDARVTLQGKKIKLRPDGTFSLRFALPDGKQVFEAIAISRDGLEEREITPVVERRTKVPRVRVQQEA